MLNLRNRIVEEEITDFYRKVAIFEIIIIGILLCFFTFHIILQTGFFTSSFMISDVLILYGLLFLNLGAILLRLIFNSKNSTRPLRMLSNILTSIGILILWLRFPFSSEHFGDVVPILGEFLSDLMVNYIYIIMPVLVFSFAIFGIYDGVLIYLVFRVNFNVTTEKNGNNQITTNGNSL